MGLLLDTDILIDFSRRRAPAIDFLNKLSEPYSVSVLTVTELLAGVRTKTEEAQLQSLFAAVACHAVTMDIANMAGMLCRQYRPSHGVGVVDCVIAATAMVLDLRLASRNAKHYPMIDDLLIPYVL